MATKKVTFTIDEDVLKDLEKMSAETLVPKARLVSESIKKSVQEHQSKGQG